MTSLQKRLASKTCVHNLPAAGHLSKLSNESGEFTLIWQNLEARMQCSVPTCSQSKFHFVVQDIADIQHTTAQPVHMKETGSHAMNQWFKLRTLSS